MKRTAIKPHVAWSGPQPDREVDAYLLAMLLRVYSDGVEDEKTERDAMLHPSVLTTKNLHMVAVMYAFYRERLEEEGIRNHEAMLKYIRDSDEEEVVKWLDCSETAVRRAEAELLEYVETPGNTGFSAFG